MIELATVITVRLHYLPFFYLNHILLSQIIKSQKVTSFGVAGFTAWNAQISKVYLKVSYKFLKLEKNKTDEFISDHKVVYQYH